jgi:hypothetical protein
MGDSPTKLAAASVRPENDRHAEAEPLTGNGYRFKIGDFQATVISDGYAPILAPIFVVNAAEAELVSALKANFMQPVIQVGTAAYPRRRRLWRETRPVLRQLSRARGKHAAAGNHVGEHDRFYQDTVENIRRWLNDQATG